MDDAIGCKISTVDRPSKVNFRHVAGRFWAALPGQVLKIVDRSKYQVVVIYSTYSTH